MNENGMENAIETAKNLGISTDKDMDLNAAIKSSSELLEACGIAMVGSIGENSYPNIKAMFKVETEGIKTIWFSTNTSSKRVAQFKSNPKACVYFADQENFKGLMLVGDIEVLSDYESKKRLWSEGCEIYYPLGIEDPDYSVLRFTANCGNYYHGLKNTSFEV